MIAGLILVPEGKENVTGKKRGRWQHQRGRAFTLKLIGKHISTQETPRKGRHQRRKSRMWGGKGGSIFCRRRAFRPRLHNRAGKRRGDGKFKPVKEEASAQILRTSRFSGREEGLGGEWQGRHVASPKTD